MKKIYYLDIQRICIVEKVKIFYDYKHALFYEVLLELNISNVNKLVINN